MSDPFNLQRFLDAQVRDYDAALDEIRSGSKRTHWMWYVFPQFDGLGASGTSQHYAVKTLAEAAAYLAHPILGSRLRECAAALLRLKGRSASDVFHTPDDLKLRSSATLFAAVSAEGSLFHRILDRYFGGKPDDHTLRLIRQAEHHP